MAITKLGNTKSTSRAINYAEKRAVVKSALNCDVEYAKSSFKQLRALYGKEDGVQGHTIIQSFKPGEVTEEQCNELGLQLVREVAPNYQVAVYTHNDKDHLHNHIIINSVNIETSYKYQSNKKQRELIKRKNDEICREHGLSVPEKSNRLRYTQTEKALVEKGKTSWKDQLRESINIVKAQNRDFESFKTDLGSLGIETKLRGSTVSYLHPKRKKWVRGKTLGADYELEALENEFGRFFKRTKKEESEREWDGIRNEVNELESENRERGRKIGLASQKRQLDNDEQTRTRRDSLQAGKRSIPSNYKSRERGQGLGD